MMDEPNSGLASNDVPDSTAVIEAEAAKREATAKRRKVHEQFFAGAGKKKKAKLSSVEKFVKSIQIKPLLCGPATPAAVRRMGKVDDNKYQKYISMSEDGVKLHLPAAAILEKHDELLLQRERLKEITPEPEDYLEQQEIIKDDLEYLYPAIIDLRNEVAEAAEDFHASIYNRCVCKEMDDLVGLREWSKIVDALVCLGIDTIIEELKTSSDENKKVEEEKKKEEAAAVRRRALLETSAIINEENATEDNATNNDVSTAIANTNCDKVQDKNGNWVPIESLVKYGSLHIRQRPIVDKKKTKRAGAISRQGLIQVTPYEMSFVKYKTWLKKPWTSKSKT